MILFGDARAAAVTGLATALAARSEAYAAGAHVAGKLPNPTALPCVVISNDGVPSNVGHEVQQLTTLRVSVWHSSDEAAHDLAQLCRALLVVGVATGLDACVPLTGPFPTVDPLTGGPLVYFTVQAVMRGTRVA